MKELTTARGGNLQVELLEVGDLFVEAEYGIDILEVLTEPVTNGDKITWKALNINTLEEVDFLITKGYAHYGPKLYTIEESRLNVRAFDKRPKKEDD